MSDRLGLLVVTLSIIVITMVGCGTAVTEDDFRRDCERDGGTYTNVQNDSPMCTYNSKEQP